MSGRREGGTEERRFSLSPYDEGMMDNRSNGCQSKEEKKSDQKPGVCGDVKDRKQEAWRKSSKGTNIWRAESPLGRSS